MSPKLSALLCGIIWAVRPILAMLAVVSWGKDVIWGQVPKGYLKYTETISSVCLSTGVFN